MDRPEGEDRPRRMRDRLVAVVVVEAAALGIALVTPITPSKTGSTWSAAELFWTEPTYVEKVLVDFVAVNLLIAVVGLVAWLSMGRGRSK